MTSIESILFKRQRRCTGHVSSMQDRRMAKALIYGELRSGKRKRGALRKRYKDQFHKQLKVSGIRESIDSKWKQLSLVRDCWKETIKHAAASFEESRKVAVEEKRQCRKEAKLNCQQLKDFLFHPVRESAKRVKDCTAT